MKGKSRSFTRFLSMMLVFLLLFASSGAGQWAEVARAADEPWVNKDAGTTGGFNKVAHHNGNWIAVGNTGLLRKSGDGETWSPSGSYATSFFGVTHGLGYWVIVGSGGVLYTSDNNGDSWVARTSGVAANLRSVAANSTTLVTVGDGGNIVYSLDGQNWTPATGSPFGTTLRGVTYGGGQFVAVGDSGKIYTSTDGIAWSPQTSPTTQTLLEVAYADGKYIVVGLNGMLLYSENGTAWEQQTVPSGATTLYGVTYGQGKFTVVGLSGTVIHSADGKLWEAEASGIATHLTHIAFGTNKYVAVGVSGKVYVRNAAMSTNANLSSLTLSAGTLSPLFSSSVEIYTANVANGVTFVDVTPTVEDANATVEVQGASVTSGTASTVPLSVGNNEITILVTAQSGATKTYKVTVNRALSGNNNLSNLTLSTGSLTPGFASGTTSYTQNVPYAVTSVNVTPTVADTTATVTVNGAAVDSGSAATVSPLDQGENTITVTVKAQNNATKTYTVKVTRGAPSANADLSGLTLSAGSLSPSFDPAEIGYDASVVNGVTSVDVTPVTSDSTATITVKGTSVASGNSVNVPLTVGANPIPVLVMAENGTTKTYTVTVHRAMSSNTQLAGLTLSTGSLSPSFTGGVRSYNATVANGVTSVDVTPDYAESTQSVKINGTPVSDGASKTITPLAVGPNTVTVVVTAENGDSDQYEITVTREKSDNADLSALSVSNGPLNPGFDPDTLSYDAADVANEVTSVSITPTVADDQATVTVDGTLVASGTARAVSLGTGLNAIPVVVTAENGSTKTYIINVTRAKSANNDLTDLTISEGSLNPLFATGQQDYTVEVGNEVTSLDVTPTLADTTASVTVNGSPVASGSSKTVTSLVVGENTITVAVRAENGATKNYVIVVTRLKSSNADLSNLTISKGTLTPGFDASIEQYTAEVGNEVTSLDVTPTAADSTATITVDGSPVASGASTTISSLPVGTTTITIAVEAEDGTPNVYEIKVTRLPSSNANLISLTVSKGSLTPTFDSSEVNYTVEVANDVTALDVTPTVADSTATVTVNGDPVVSGTGKTISSLAVGTPKTITVTVKAQDGTEKEYEIIVTRLPSSNADLSNLTISEGTLAPVFASSSQNYTAEVGNEVTSLTVTPTVADSTATVSVNGVAIVSGTGKAVALSTGPNTITVAVEAEDGTPKEYEIIVTRAKSDNANLSNLMVSAGTLTPGFSAGEKAYTVEVGNEVTSLTVTPTAAESMAEITVNGVEVVSGTGKAVSPLAVGPNTITIAVTAEDGTPNSYVITVNRAESSNADLSNLTVSEGSLTPAFASGEVNYTVEVANDVTSLDVTPTVADSTASVNVNGDPVVSGNAKTISSLAVGENTITIAVEAEDGTPKVYEIIVTRLQSGNNNLSNLTVSAGTLDPVFAPGEISYSVSVGNEVTSLDLTPTVDDLTASVKVAGADVVSGNAHTVALHVGANPIQVTVTAENGSTKTYTVTVTRAASSNNNLSNVTISQGTLTPVFSSETTDYTADVTASVNSLELTPTVADGTATVKVNGKAVTSGNAIKVVLKPGSNTITVLVTAENGSTKTYTLVVTRPSGGGGGGGGGTPSDIIDGVIRVVNENGQPLNENVTKLLGSNVPLTAAIYAADGKTLLQAGIDVEANGTFKMKRVTSGTYKMFLYPLAPNGEKLAGAEGTLTVQESASSLQIEMINPFGTVRDSVTNEAVDGVKVSLYWADTEQNRSKGRTPGTLVSLPQLPEMMPGQNVNGQLSSLEGEYGFLMFPEGAYYLIAERSGYETYDSRLDPETGILLVDRIAVTTDFKMKALETREHLPYILGYADGTFQPNKGITRAELATILTRLFANGEVGAQTASFGDVNHSHWAAKSIAFVHGKNVMVGYPDGNFYPNRVVTRAEMAMVLAKLKQLPNAAGTSAFTDLGDHWAKDAILKAEKAGLLNGFPDGTFRPNAELTRAQTVVILNKLLERHPRSVEGSPKWSDVAPDYWAYKDIMEASVRHKYHLVDGVEVWIK
ncbi:cadherin-like beta sandwich domain-containing protein [Tumebacillus sp. DT12]|uniref:Cadherin-like beta sandwich domain-containing protein n=1 Tax=Tumebacillus lacus TaxID=2995335 RepID=A0ABT3X4P7_9BACL|nr:cadherin-like beta sandwich domain-containing protein [Tumebacillus lacus]MCX7571876.1 cadherin-like beta sandwich domain-containing protein [Tumebacillus lacus]